MLCLRSACHSVCMCAQQCVWLHVERIMRTCRPTSGMAAWSTSTTPINSSKRAARHLGETLPVAHAAVVLASLAAELQRQQKRLCWLLRAFALADAEEKPRDGARAAAPRPRAAASGAEAAWGAAQGQANPAQALPSLAASGAGGVVRRYSSAQKAGNSRVLQRSRLTRRHALVVVHEWHGRPLRNKRFQVA